MSNAKPSISGLNLHDVHSVKQVLNDLYARQPRAASIPLLEARLLLESGSYAEAGARLLLIVNNFKPHDQLFQIGLRLLGLINNHDGFLIVLDEIKTPLIDKLIATHTSHSLSQALEFLGYNQRNDIKRLHILSEHFVAVFANRAYDEDKFDTAFFLEQKIYQCFVTKSETEAAFEFAMGLTKDSATRAGQRVGQSFGEKNLNFNNKTQIVGFFFHNASMLAHISNIYSYLKQVCSAPTPKFKPIIFCLGGRHNEFSNKFSNIGVDIVYLDDDGVNGPGSIRSISDRLQALNVKCAELQVDKIIWGCLALNMAFTFSMRIAKEQIWWSQKWRAFDLSEIDKRIWSFSMHESEKMLGDEWLCGWFQKETWLEPISELSVRQTRSQLDARVVVGCLARTEKMANVRYLNAICEILANNEDVLFLWTGREESAFISKYFRAKGVYKKTKYIGWVDVNLYARVLDVVLDSFPFGNGNSILAAMQAGVPVLMWKSSPESNTFDLVSGSFLDETLDPNRDTDKMRAIFKASDDNPAGLYTCVDNEKSYIQMANKLIQDEGYRTEVGLSYQRFVDEMMREPAKAEQKFTRHILT